MKPYRRIPILGKFELLKLGGNDHWMKVFFVTSLGYLKFYLRPPRTRELRVVGPVGHSRKRGVWGKASALLLVAVAMGAPLNLLVKPPLILWLLLRGNILGVVSCFEWQFG